MLQFFRSNAKGWFGKIIVGAIVLVFTLWGATSIVGVATSNNAPVIVNGVEISEFEINRMTEIQRRNIQTQLGDSYDPDLISDSVIRQSVIQNLVSQQLELQSAADQGLAFSDEAVTRIIVNTAAFKKDGKFDSDTYTRLIGQYGYSPSDYVEVVRQDMMVNQMKSGMLQTAFVTDNEVQKLAKLDSQTRNVQSLVVSVEDFLDRAEVDDQSIETFYENNQQQYLTEEQLVVDYILLDKSRLADTIMVSDEELEQAYQNYRTQQAGDTEKTIAHILVTTDSRSNSEAEQLANNLKSQIEQGASFAEIAEQNSEDPGSAAQGGELGTYLPGMFVPEFDAAVEQLDQSGQVVGPIKTDFGYHLITVTEIAEPVIADLDSVREELRSDIVDRKVDDELIILREDLSNLAFAELTLPPVAEQFGLTIQQSEPFGKEGGSGVFAEPAILDAAFDPVVIENNENSSVVRLADGSLVVMHLNNYQPTSVLPLEEVKERIVAELRFEEAKILAEEKALELEAEIRSADSLNLDSSDYQWTYHDQMNRSAGDVAGEVVRLAFKMPKPENDGFSLGRTTDFSGNYYLVAVTGVQIPDALSDEGEVDSLASYLASVVGDIEYSLWFESKVDNSTIKYRQ